MLDLGIAGKTAVVCGASRGIGLAVAEVLISNGANVALTSRREESAIRAADELNAAAGRGFGRAVGVGAHAADEEAARGCVSQVMERFGSLDILINNAGTNPAHGQMVDQDHARFSKTFDVNVWAPMMWTALAVEAWMGEHGGAIVNTASIGGYIVEADLGVYNLTKAALIHMTRQHAAELGPRVRVNAVAPGVVRTKLAELLWLEHEQSLSVSLPMRRIGEPHDIAQCVAFLASDAASWITGQTIVVDGGRLVSDVGATGSPREAGAPVG